MNLHRIKLGMGSSGGHELAEWAARFCRGLWISPHPSSLKGESLAGNCLPFKLRKAH